MKKMWKRFVSLLLACTLLAGMLPLSASAAGAPTETEWIKKIISDLEEDKYELQAKTQLSGSDVWMYIYVKSYWDSELEQSVNDTVFIFHLAKMQHLRKSPITIVRLKESLGQPENLLQFTLPTE